MKNIMFIVGIALLALHCEAVAAQRPNVVLILLDDVGTGWIPPYADRLQPDDVEAVIAETYAKKQNKGLPVDLHKHLEAARSCMPKLSELAKEGAVFDNGFATASLCAPSRAGLLTGSFQQRWGGYRNVDIDKVGIPEDRVLMAEPLQAAGYRCGMVGKWHVSAKDESLKEKLWTETLGHELPIPDTFTQFYPEWRDAFTQSGYPSSCAPEGHPLARGFDYYFGFNLYQSSYYNAQDLWENRERVPPRPEGEFLTDLLTDKSCRFIESALKDKKPFFLYYAPMTLHGRIVPPPKEYSNPFDTGIKVSNEYAGHLLALDRGIKQIFDILEKHGQVDNTLFIFSSDNGCTTYGVPPYNAPNRGGKGTSWLGGLNVPLIIWHKGIVKPGINREITSLADLMPTVLDAAGVEIPANIDGKNLMPFLRGEVPNGPRDSLVSSGVHSSRWSYSYEAKGEWNPKDTNYCPLYAWSLQGDLLRLLITGTQPGLYKALPDGLPSREQLFDLAADRQQNHNLVERFPEQVRSMDKAIHRWLETMDVPITSQQQDYHLLLEQTK